MTEGYKKSYGKYKDHGTRFAKKVHHHALSTPKKIVISCAAVLLAGVLAFQFMYPSDSLLPFAKVGDVSVGSMKQQDAKRKLAAAYGDVKVPVYFSSDSELKVAPAYADLGVKINSDPQIEAYSYPWYMRLVPSSFLWYGLVGNDEAPAVKRDSKVFDAYFAKYFGADCSLAPVNSTLLIDKDTLKVVPAVSGGTCDYNELHPKLKDVTVGLDEQKVVVKGTTVKPDISDDMAEVEKVRVEALLEKGITLKVADTNQKIPTADVISWITYGEGPDSLKASLKPELSEKWLADSFGSKLARPAGVTKVVTRDFTELSRINGTSGQAIDTAATRYSLELRLRGEKVEAVAAVKPVTPTVQYERSYSPTDEGLSALLKNYAESNPGTFGISLVEFDGQKRRAEYNGARQFTTASTYKLFIAYSTLLRIEDGRWRWSDHVVGGRDVAKCFDDMIVLSDNACPGELLRRIGFKAVTEEARAIGAINTSFLGSSGIKSTANDEAVFMGALYSGQMLREQSSRDRLISALKRNVFRKGVQAGVPGVVVANKVGFLDNLLNDAAIVYSPSGTYVLVILTENSSWGAIAELTRQIEALRNGG